MRGVDAGVRCSCATACRCSIRGRNVAWIGRTQPLETVKRIEVVTGPGGVLWGANSFLGIVNLITKDAEDVNGLEVAAGYGDGPGNKQDFKAYALFGKTFFNGKLKLFQHISYESFIGEVLRHPAVPRRRRRRRSRAASPTSRQNAPRDPTRSWMRHRRRQVLARPGQPLLHAAVRRRSTRTSASATPSSPNDIWNHYDRYGVLEYKDRFAKDRVGLTVKGYGTQFVRDFSIQLFPPSALLPARSGDAERPGRPAASASPARRSSASAAPPTSTSTCRSTSACSPAASSSTKGMRDSNDDLRRSGRTRTCCRCSARCDDGMGGYAHPELPARSTPRHRPLRRRRLRRRAVAPVPEADPRRRRPHPEGLRRPALRPGAARLGRHRLQLPARLSRQAELRDRLPPAGLPEHRRPRRAASATAPTRTSRPRRRSRSRASSTRDCLRNVRKVRELELRADYSYTVLSNLIQIRGGIYGNTGKRAIHSVEGYAKLYLNGDHFLQASYTYLYSTTTDAGVMRTMPNHWVVVGALVQPGQEPARREHEPDDLRRLRGPQPHPHRHCRRRAGGTDFVGTTTARTSDLTFDRLTPVAQPAARLPPALLQGPAAALGAVLQRAQPALLLPRHLLRPDADRSRSRRRRRPASTSSPRPRYHF